MSRTMKEEDKRVSEELERISEAIAEKANECCNRSDGYEEDLKAFTLERIKGYQFGTYIVKAEEFNKMLKDVDSNVDREHIIEVSFKGICVDCGEIINDEICYCGRHD